MTTQGIHHVTLVSGDASRTVAFYRELLGLSLVRREAAADGEPGLWLGDGAGRPGTLIAFMEEPGGALGRWGIGGIHHVALGVATPALQLMWKRRLMDAGVPVTGPYDRGWFHSIYFTDPDGQVLEIATAGPGYAVDEPMEALGASVITPRASQMRGGRDEAAIRARTWPEPVTEISPAMALNGIHHITGITNDLAAVGALCEQGLGLRVVKKSVNQDDGVTPHWFWARYDGRTVTPHSTLTMFGWQGAEPVARAGPGQTHSIAYRAADDDELADVRDALGGLGVAVSAIRDRPYFRSFAFEAPDGLLVEVATDAPGFGAADAATRAAAARP